MTSTDPIKVLIVDDSAIFRSILRQSLSRESDIEVVGGAKDPFEARELIIEYRPNVIILDIEMPRMDGLTFLKKLQAHYPVPVIMCSGVAPANSKAALAAVELGAIDIVAKTNSGGRDALRRLGEDLADKIRAAAIAMQPPPPIPRSASTAAPSFRTTRIDPSEFLVAIGASTGGTEAIKEVLSHAPADFPPVAIVQHMPEGFTHSFAERLNHYSKLTVSEAVDGDVLTPGRVVVARGGIQMSVHHAGGHWRVSYGTDELVNRHCPSVDVLFDSVARYPKRLTVGIILTGMGADGAKGLVNMHDAGALTVAQEEKSCVVYGMPKVAVELGAVDLTAPPADIPTRVIRALQTGRGRRRRETSIGSSR